MGIKDGIFKIGATGSDGDTLFPGGAADKEDTLCITTAGNVGIGTTDPGAKLDIRSSSSDPSTPTVHIGDNVVDQGDYGMVNLTRHGDDGGSKAHLAFIRNGHTVTGMGFHNNTNTFGIWPSFSAVTSTPAIAFTTSGNVGIGTTDPGSLLTFYKDYTVPANGSEPATDYEQGLIFRSDLNSYGGGAGRNWSNNLIDAARIWFQPRSYVSVSSGSAGSHGALNLSAGHTTASTANPDITITSNKRVGIGVTSPDNKLEVRGSIQASLSDADHGMIIENYGTVRRDYGGDGAGFHFTSNAIWPTNHLGSYANDEIDLGNTSYRYKTIWSNNSLNSTSDDRLKHNEEEVADALGTIKKLKLLKYDKTGEMLAPDYNGDLTGISHRKELGFIAQSVLEIPELSFLVTVPGDPEDALEYGLKRGVEPYGMEYQGINNLLVQAVQELSAKNDSLEARILALENA
jgi:hypothetical protein